MTKLNFSEKSLVSYDPSEILICWSDSLEYFFYYHSYVENSLIFLWKPMFYRILSDQNIVTDFNVTFDKCIKI